MTRGLTALGHCLWEDPYCFVVQHNVWCKISVPFWSAFPAKHIFIPPHYWSFTAASFISSESLKGLRQLDCAVLQCSQSWLHISGNWRDLLSCSSRRCMSQSQEPTFFWALVCLWTSSLSPRRGGWLWCSGSQGVLPQSLVNCQHSLCCSKA